MNRSILSLLLTIITFTSFAQANYKITDPEQDYKKAKEYFIKGDYALAYPMLKILRDKYPENTTSSHAYLNQDIEYFYIVCGLQLGQSVAEEDAKSFVESSTNEPHQQMMSYHLAHYYFNRQDFARAAVYYERAGYDNLSNEEIADSKFELAYSYFMMNDYDKAKPLFNEIHQMPSNKYYSDANYYYGYISFKEKNYNQALESFKQVERNSKYSDRVPYYIAQIYYFQGKKDQTLQYAETALASGDFDNSKDVKLLAGQIYFEKKQFAKALPLLQDYVKGSEKVSKEVMYELAYCYYDANRVNEAIESFKQLSNEKDSLGQNSMYLLGDLYLRTNQKVNARNAFQYSADNNSNRFQQEVSRFNYAKLSYELGYNDIALSSINQFLSMYPTSAYANEAKEILINLLANSNNYTEALRLYESFDKPTPTMQRVYSRILFGKATEYINNRQYTEANDFLDKIIKDPYAGKMLPFAYFWKGEIAYRQTRYGNAIDYLNKYLQQGGVQGEANPDNARYSLGYCYLHIDDFSKAYQNFKEVAASSASATPTQQDAYTRSADALYMQKNYTAAKNMYQTIVNNSLPQSDYAYFQIAMIDGINNQAGKIKSLDQLVKRYPQSDLVPESYLQIANAYMTEEKFRDAIPYLKKILDIPTAKGFYPNAYLKLGLANYNLNNNPEALSWYQKLVSQYPQSQESDEALTNMRNIYIEMGKPNEYIDFAKKSGKVLSVSEADSLTYVSAERRYMDNDCAGAITSFTNYLSKFPQGAYSLNALYYRSECYVKNNDWQNAVAGYSKVVQQKNSPFVEQSALAAARIYYFNLTNYDSAKVYFQSLQSMATTQENQLEALRGLTRCYYQTKDYAKANSVATELLAKKGISTDDRAIANLVLGKSLQASNNYDQAIDAFKKVSAINKSAWGSEARYETARSYYMLNNLSAAEKAAMDVIKVAGSDYWVTSAYILLGDVYLKQKDYFNAKATYKSVADNATITELKNEASEKYQKAMEEEQSTIKVKQEGNQ